MNPLDINLWLVIEYGYGYHTRNHASVVSCFD